MARMKVEFLFHYRKRHGLRLRDRLIAYLPRYAPHVAHLASVLNMRDQLPGLPELTQKLLGLSAQRTLPVWQRNFFRGSDITSTVAGSTHGSELVLLVDTFNTYFEPENARSAIAVLQAAGYRVHIPRLDGDKRPLCCGRTFLAAGLLDEAKIEARRTIAALKSYVVRDLPIVGLEPSCLYTLRDEFVALLPGKETDAVAKSAMLFEEFLAREHAQGRFSGLFKPLPAKQALVHGHCHQKAFGAMGAVEQALRLVPGLEVAIIPSSCCGMAGSFGFDAEHYDVSMQMGELDLLPAVRQADPDVLIAADGTSCRHQILHGTKREALHVARILESALA
jgi:Fe-S oxidoreductase